MRKVLILGPNMSYISMMEEAGWEVVVGYSEANLLLFTGGADVDPILYDEEPHPTTFSNFRRDQDDKHYYLKAQKDGIPCAGICRGGQLLNVLNGGKMFQHVHNHAIYGTHNVYDLIGRESIPVTSTHHQMMRPASNGKVLAVADNLSPSKEHMTGYDITIVTDEPQETEAVLYEDTKSLCFQPHPEFDGYKPCRDLFFSYLKLLGV